MSEPEITPPSKPKNPRKRPLKGRGEKKPPSKSNGKAPRSAKSGDFPRQSTAMVVVRGTELTTLYVAKDGTTSEEKTTHPGGAPPKYHPDMCHQVIGYGHEGYSYTTIAVKMGIARETLYDWGREHEEFSDALTRSRQAAQSWWETKAIDNLTNKQFQANLWAKNVACRFPDDWREDNTVIVKQATPINIKDLTHDELRQLGAIAENALRRKAAGASEGGDGSPGG